MEFGMFYEIQVPRPASPEAEHERLREVVDQVVLAEEMGFDEVWFVEHHFLTEWAHSSASEVMLSVLSQHKRLVAWANSRKSGHQVLLGPTSGGRSSTRGPRTE